MQVQAQAACCPHTRLVLLSIWPHIMCVVVAVQGTLAQMHLMDGSGRPDMVVLALLLAFFGGATLVGSAQTLNKMRNKALTPE